MERNDDKFREQEAPLKNTDQAFVQVGADGHPQMPREEEKNEEEPKELKGDEARKHH
jgi:hypothetical protein